ncbi:MAG: hypothetical protein CBB60_003655 [Armatimonadetes bacterium Cent15-Ar3]|nr:MAG: hypothetical protein CBB60_003655 [Armatimonadetes bacterium Cent15-Ar3]
MQANSNTRDLATNSGCTILLAGACVVAGFIMIVMGDSGPGKTYHAGGMLWTSCLYLVPYFFISLGYPPKGRWAGHRQPLALVAWLTLGACLMCLIEYLSHNTCCTGSIYGDILAWMSLTWLPTFWLVKLAIDLLSPKPQLEPPGT